MGKFNNVADIQDLALTDSNNPEEKIYLRDVARSYRWDRRTKNFCHPKWKKCRAG
ncbi:MAG UNVERIFIED_CONTAM: hypothetical protein LVR29_09675 [Microcystis novacekii LVE1205-3]